MFVDFRDPWRQPAPEPPPRPAPRLSPRAERWLSRLVLLNLALLFIAPIGGASLIVLLLGMAP